MSLEERRVVDLLEVLRDGTVQVREAIEVLRDGAVIAQQYHRKVVGILDEGVPEEGLDAASLAVVNAARSPSRRAVAQANFAAGTGEPGPAWVAPEGAHNAYAEGARVTHAGRQWVSLLAANVWEPGVSGWAEVTVGGEPPAWVQPTGAHDAYALGDRVTHAGQVWVSDLDGNVWEPGVYGWTAE